MSYRVIVLPQAIRDFEGCATFVGRRSPKGERALRAAFAKATKSLEINAAVHGLAPESADHEIDIKQTFFRTRHGRPYRILFTIDRDEVYLLHVRGPGQDFITPDDFKLT